jgi:predicted KAP-like P-loop ATPase
MTGFDERDQKLDNATKQTRKKTDWKTKQESHLVAKFLVHILIHQRRFANAFSSQVKKKKKKKKKNQSQKRKTEHVRVSGRIVNWLARITHRCHPK